MFLFKPSIVNKSFVKPLGAAAKSLPILVSIIPDNLSPKNDLVPPKTLPAIVCNVPRPGISLEIFLIVLPLEKGNNPSIL